MDPRPSRLDHDRVPAWRHADPRRRLARRRGRASAGWCSAPTAAARRRCCGSPRCTSTRRRAPSRCSASGSGAPTCAMLRRRVGYVSAALADQLRPELRGPRRRAHRPYAALEPWWHRYTSRRRPGAGLPRPHGRRPLRRPPARHAVVGRAPAGAAGPHADERSGGRPARRAVGPARPRRPRAARRRARRARRRPGAPAVRASSPTTSTTSRRRTTPRAAARATAGCSRAGPIDDVLDADGAQRVLRAARSTLRAPRATAGSARGRRRMTRLAHARPCPGGSRRRAPAAEHAAAPQLAGVGEIHRHVRAAVGRRDGRR